MFEADPESRAFGLWGEHYGSGRQERGTIIMGDPGVSAKAAAHSK